MNAKKPKSPTSPPKSPSRRKARATTARQAEATVKLERDAFARQILDRMMTEFGPINFTKAELFEEMSRHPTPEELIRQLVAQSER